VCSNTDSLLRCILVIASVFLWSAGKRRSDTMTNLVLWICNCHLIIDETKGRQNYKYRYNSKLHTVPSKLSTQQHNQKTQHLKIRRHRRPPAQIMMARRSVLLLSAVFCMLLVTSGTELIAAICIAVSAHRRLHQFAGLVVLLCCGSDIFVQHPHAPCRRIKFCMDL
jgi:hypothetical protein